MKSELLEKQKEAKGRKFAVQAATFSLWVPLVGIIVGMLSNMSGSHSGMGGLIIACTFMVLYVVAFFLSIYALVSVRKYGTKGILFRAIIGFLFNGAIIAVTILIIPAMRKARAFAAQANIKIQAPLGFRDYPEAKTRESVLQAFISGDPLDAEPDIVLLVIDLGGIIGKENLALAAAKKEGVEPVKLKWKSHDIPVVKVSERHDDGLEIMTYNAQVPLVPKAIQIRVAGVKEKEEELEQILRIVLSSIEGESNW
jgi:hypothetical protein